MEAHKEDIAEENDEPQTIQPEIVPNDTESEGG
jgi:hypothetical protein